MIRGSTLWRLSLGKRAQRPGVRNGLSLLPQTLASFPAQLFLLSLILPHWVSTPTISERIPVLVFLETSMLWYLMVYFCLHCMEPGTDVFHRWSCSPSKSDFPLSVSRMLLWFLGIIPHVHLQCWYLCWYLLFQLPNTQGCMYTVNILSSPFIFTLLANSVSFVCSNTTHPSILYLWHCSIWKLAWYPTTDSLTFHLKV